MTDPYTPGKLVDITGQGSTNDNYGTTIQVPPLMQQADPGNMYGNPTPVFRVADLVVFGLGAALFAVAAPAAASTRGKKKRKKEVDLTRALGAVVMGAAAVGVVARWFSPNFDSAASLVPGNVGIT